MKIQFLIPLLALTLFACAQISGNDEAPSILKQGTGARQEGVQGNWRTACSGSTSSSASFVKSDLYFSTNTYKTAGCSGVLGSVLEMSFTFETSSQSVTDPSMYNFEYVLQAVTLVVFDPSTADVFNTVSHCGFTDWSVGVKKNITGRACVTGPIAGAITYSILRQSGDQLQVGTTDGTNSGTSEALRHVLLDSNTFSRIY